MLKKIISSKKSGYLMIEVLVALIIFSTSLIALIALQLNSYTSTQSSSYRNMATNYANDFLDKMRANKTSAINGSYTATEAKNNKCRSVNFNVVNTIVDCNSLLMAQDDLAELNSQVSSTLPQGEVVVCLDSSQSQGTPDEPNCDETGSIYVVKIFWKDTRSKLLATNSGYSQVIIGGRI